MNKVIIIIISTKLDVLNYDMSFVIFKALGLGIALSNQDLVDIGTIVKKPTPTAWRIAANESIEANRKVTTTFLVIDDTNNGSPVPGANIHVNLKSHEFKV